AVPVVGRDVGIAHLGRGRHLGQRLRTLRARDGERLQLAGADVAQQHRHVEDAHLYLPAQEIAYRRRGAFVRHVHQVDLRLGLEQLAGELLKAEAKVDLVHRSEEHTSELQSPCNLVCRLLLEKKKKKKKDKNRI